MIVMCICCACVCVCVYLFVVVVNTGTSWPQRDCSVVGAELIEPRYVCSARCMAVMSLVFTR